MGTGVCALRARKSTSFPGNGLCCPRVRHRVVGRPGSAESQQDPSAVGAGGSFARHHEYRALSPDSHRIIARAKYRPIILSGFRHCSVGGIVHRNLLWLAVNSHVAFSVWYVRSVMVLFMPQSLHGFLTGEKLLIDATASLAGTLARNPYSLTVHWFSGGTRTTATSLLLLSPIAGTMVLLAHPGLAVEAISGVCMRLSQDFALCLAGGIAARNHECEFRVTSHVHGTKGGPREERERWVRILPGTITP